jgi:NosR/NirI family nitrous oxide reductase transcriptional regulator
VCPFGNAQRLALRITPKKMTSNLPISAKWVGRTRNGIALVLIVGVLVGLRDWGNFEPFPDLFGMNLRSAWFFVALASVLVTVRYPLVWCRLLCPTGSVLDIISDSLEKGTWQRISRSAKLFRPSATHL